MSTPTPDYGEPWEIDKHNVALGDSGDFEGVIEIYTHDKGDRIAEIWNPEDENETFFARIVACVNALACVQDPSAHLANLSATIERWESELSAVMPPDFKDWFQNDKSEWPMVARQVIESLREREAFCMRVIEHCEDTIKTMNDALKEAHRIFGNLNHSQVVQRLCPDFAEVAELVGKSHDPHA